MTILTSKATQVFTII